MAGANKSSSRRRKKYLNYFKEHNTRRDVKYYLKFYSDFIENPRLIGTAERIFFRLYLLVRIDTHEKHDIISIYLVIITVKKLPCK